MDAQDKARTLSNKAKLLQALKQRGVLTNEQARRIAGSRALARAWELQKEGHDISIRKLHGAVWEIRLNMRPLGRDAMHRIEQKSLF